MKPKAIGTLSLIVIVFCSLYYFHFRRDLSSKIKKEVSLVKAVLPPFSGDIDTEKIRSASQYVIASHLVRNLIQVDNYLRINGDLAESWNVDQDSKKFFFRIKDQQLFSDGSQISAKDLEKTIQRQMDLNVATHFNFSDIQKVSSENKTLVIELKKPNRNFIYSLNHPEFGVLHKSDYDQPNPMARLKITSGPYFLDAIKPNHAQLSKNVNYDPKLIYPEKLEIFGPDFQGDADFYFSMKLDDVHKKLESNPNFKEYNPHIGFSFWLSFSKNSNFSHANRMYLQKLLQLDESEFSIFDGYWAPAKQLYLPDGFGRLTRDEVDAIWSKIRSDAKPNGLPSEIRILLYNNFPLNKALEEKLKSQFRSVKIDLYANMAEFETLQKKNSYDLFLINNDFSSADLIENIKVTFNPTRPLIISKSQQEFQNIIKDAENSEDPIRRAQGLQTIERSVLTNSDIVPLAFMNIKFFANKELDLSQWSMLRPEISFWKTKWKE